MREVANGFRQRRFCDLSDRDKRGILKLIVAARNDVRSDAR